MFSASQSVGITNASFSREPAVGPDTSGMESSVESIGMGEVPTIVEDMLSKCIWSKHRLYFEKD